MVYVDESGDPNLKKINPNFPVFVLTLCVVKKEVYAEKIIPEMSKFKFRHFGHDMVVLHERDIRKQTGDFRKLFKTPLQFRLARTSNCHAGQIAVTSLLKGTFEELPSRGSYIKTSSWMSSLRLLMLQR